MKSKSVIRASLRATVLTLFISVLVYSCTDQSLETTDSRTDTPLSAEESEITTSNLSNPFQKTVGAPIDKSVGLRWIDNYNRANGTALEYEIKAETISQILAQPNCNGITFRYGRDESGNNYIMPIGVDNTGREMQSEKVATSNGTIDWRTAQELAGNYDEPVRSHFFGADTFDRLFQKECDIVLISAALDDDNQPRLLLTNKNSPDPSFVEDESSPCPPYCENQF